VTYRRFSVPGTNFKLSHCKTTCRDWPYPRRLLKENGQIPEDDLLRLAKSQQAGISKEDLMNQQSKAIFRGQAIPACCKLKLTGIFKLTFRGLKNAGKSL
jgi:hypothetical protein